LIFVFVYFKVGPNLKCSVFNENKSHCIINEKIELFVYRDTSDLGRADALW